MKKPIINAILWDMDGVLIDSERLHFDTVVEVAARYGFHYTEEINLPFFGMRDIDLFRNLCKRYPFPKSPEILTDERQSLYVEYLLKLEAVKPMPGVLSLLHFFKEQGLSQAVVSSSTRLVVDAVLDVLQIGPYFDTLVTGDLIDKGKPDPEGYLLGAKKVGQPSANCLVIEDSLNGIKAAKSAGSYCIMVAAPMLEEGLLSHPKAADDPVEATYEVDSLEEFDRENWFVFSEARRTLSQRQDSSPDGSE